MESAGSNDNLTFAGTPAFFVLAIVCMLRVTKGEAKSVAGGETALQAK